MIMILDFQKKLLHKQDFSQEMDVWWGHDPLKLSCSFLYDAESKNWDNREY